MDGSSLAEVVYTVFKSDMESGSDAEVGNGDAEEAVTIVPFSCSALATFENPRREKNFDARIFGSRT